MACISDSKVKLSLGLKTQEAESTEHKTIDGIVRIPKHDHQSY